MMPTINVHDAAHENISAQRRLRFSPIINSEIDSIPSLAAWFDQFLSVGQSAPVPKLVTLLLISPTLCLATILSKIHNLLPTTTHHTQAHEPTVALF